MFLSRNETKLSYHETEEELILAQISGLIQARKTDVDEPPYMPEAGAFNILLRDVAVLSKKASCTSNIWQSAHMVNLLFNLHTGGVHFMNSPITKMSWLKNMSSDQGGVSSQVLL